MLIIHFLWVCFWVKMGLFWVIMGFTLLFLLFSFVEESDPLPFRLVDGRLEHQVPNLGVNVPYKELFVGGKNNLTHSTG